MKKERVINMTPHPINILGADDKEITTIHPCGQLIRLQAKTVGAGSVDGIALTKTVFGEPEGLPEATEGTFFVVSQLVRNACPNRKDLLVPAEVVRDKAGRIVGCRSLGI